MTILKTFGAAVMTATFAIITSSATAATIPSTVVDFSSSDNPATVPNSEESAFIIDGYQIFPVNLQNGQCAEDPCSNESSVGDGMGTRIENLAADNGGGNQWQTLSGVTRPDDMEFELVNFWFTMQGQGQGDTKNITVLAWQTGSGPDEGDADFRLELNMNADIAATEAFYAAYGLDIEFFPGDSGTNSDPDPACLTTTICDGVGYLASVMTWTGLEEVIWDVDTEGQSRIDCIGLYKAGGQPAGNQCTPTGGGDDDLNEIPLPAAGWMLIAGIGGMAALRRRKKA